MNWYAIFYWLSVANNARGVFIAFVTIFTLIALIATIAYFANLSEDNEAEAKLSRKWMWWSYPFMTLFWLLIMFTPSRKDTLLIIAGGGTMEFLSNDSTARQIPKEMTSFVLTELKSMGAEVRNEIGVQNQKEKILEQAKKMTSEELLKKIKSDSTFAKVVLDGL